MAAAVRVSLEEYLNTEYQPDCDYIDGVLEDRNAGKKKHAETANRGSCVLPQPQEALKHPRGDRTPDALSPTRVRIPDVAIVTAEDTDEVNQRPPLLCIEILSPEDCLSRVPRVVADYLAFGVPLIWIVDPYDSKAFVVSPENRTPQEADELRWKDIVVQLSEILPE